MRRTLDASVAAALAAAILHVPAFSARAEKADRDKPTQLEAARMSSDDARRVSIFEGNVVLSKGTLSVRADRIVVRVDADGFQHATATGNPVRFRQKGEGQRDRAGVWTDAEALRVEIDDRNERIELFERARVARDQDEVRGEYIFLDQRSEFFSVSAAKGASPAAAEGRVRAVIQPKAPPASASQPPPANPAAAPAQSPAPALPEAGKPPAR
ncbi:MAG: lipopolysaccharide transport periplasmic protein LptA [Betaproteobacteria bacterium RIFCSPLOWO2_02_67_12]|nr:MAG: lipopolysaccharide transport periplasmic protein LptA [Betaproteobacteria bacterium RIFCSPLOWO2_02_67_12]